MPWGYAAAAGATLVAGSMQADAAKSGSDAGVAATDRATAEQRRQYDLTRQDQKPFQETGVAANARLRQLMGLDSGYSGADSGSLLRRFSSSDLESDPVYQSGLKFGLDQGTGAINARATQQGGFDSGATLKALTRYANDYGSTKANESYNRYNTDQTNIYNRLGGVSGAGQTATNQVQAAGTNMANNVSDLATQAGNARAAGVVGQANAWGGALQGGVNAYQNYQNNQFLQELLRKNNNTGSVSYPSSSGNADYGFN